MKVKKQIFSTDNIYKHKKQKNMKELTILLSFTVFASVLYGQAVCDGEQIYLIENGECDYRPYILVFEDNFNDNSFDLSKWKLPYQGVTRDFTFDNEKEWYANTGSTPSLPINNNIQVSNGTLKLIAKKEVPPIIGTFVTDWSTIPPTTQTENFNYSSANIDSKYKFGYGIFEIRCKIPKGKGFWPAFWTFGVDENQTNNEIDVFEFWDNNTINHNMTVHYDGQMCLTDYNGPDYSLAFHTFTMAWDIYKIEWYVDGDLKRRSTKFYTMLGQTIGCEIQAGHYIRDKVYPKDPMNIIVNLAIESGKKAPNALTPFPSSLEVDYVRYYQQMSCDGPVNATDISDLNLSNNMYNLVIGPSINLSENITIQSGQQLELVASDKIVLGPGFTAKIGSDFVAKIDPNICDGEDKTGCTSNDAGIYKDSSASIKKSSAESKIVKTKMDCKIRITPNPNTGKFTLKLDPASIDLYELYLIDKYGRVLYSLKSINNPNIEIDISKYSSGVYFLMILDTKNNNTFTHKVFIVK